MKIDRACPRCKSRHYHNISKPVPATYGSDSQRAVLASCAEPAGRCGHQWRALLRQHEYEDFTAALSTAGAK